MNFKTEKPTSLLSVNADAKTVKGKAHGYLTGILYLSPSDTSGHQVCPGAKRAGCEAACLNRAGKGGMNSVQNARLRKTRLFFDEREWFMAQLTRDIESLQRKAQREGALPAVRLNGTSDINWQTVPLLYRGEVYSNIFKVFPNVQFYDYSKYLMSSKESNYHLTFSYSPLAAFSASAYRAVEEGLNLAVVFRGQPPETFLGMPVIDGDATDLRFMDPPYHVVALKAKGPAKKDFSGFVVDMEQALKLTA